MATQIDLPHTLGRDEARSRMKARTGDLPNHIPGGVADVRSSWPEDYQMALSVAALGQTVSGTLDVEDRRIRISLELPPMLRFASGAIEAAVQRKGRELLLGDSTSA
jgi:hypothetical protein